MGCIVKLRMRRGNTKEGEGGGRGGEEGNAEKREGVYRINQTRIATHPTSNVKMGDTLPTDHYAFEQWYPGNLCRQLNLFSLCSTFFYISS